jgi:hypothetical protein
MRSTWGSLAFEAEAMVTSVIFRTGDYLMAAAASRSDAIQCFPLDRLSAIVESQRERPILKGGF